ncbi:MAG: helix-turn-helix domain-containing protein [Verrucomicrobia bacterium]|jgi:phage repressor protein C with HTH and peptisase S24 domain|nr:helix-turn-helix domain-containing protein [Verrucomicrobiota bacterium]MBO7107198.1 helix-turn-helix domain-containing protein [Verrucomicrobiota bacterium]
MQNNLKKLRKAHGWTLRELSTRSGIAVSTLGNFENGCTGISVPALLRLAHIFQVSLDQLLFGTGGADELDLSARKPRLVPVISWARAGLARDYSELSGQLDEVLPSECPDENAFALILDGDSMEPEFHAGDRIIFSPSTEPRNGDYVVARFRENADPVYSLGVVFKKYKRVGKYGEKVLLQSLNPIYPDLIKPADEFLFIYPAVSQMRYLRR